MQNLQGQEPSDLTFSLLHHQAHTHLLALADMTIPPHSMTLPRGSNIN